MQPPSTEAVYQAVCALHNNPDSTAKEKTSLWLGEVQKSIPCWKIADELLHQKRDLHSCYFAAQTMRTKIQHSFHELPLESHRSLRDSLIEHIESFTPDTNAVIITQLCVALADLALQMTSWRNCANDLINKFSTSNVWALLEILTVLPQEIDSRSLRLGENRREEIKCELKSNSREVVAFLKQTLINAGPNTHVALKVVKSLTSWISIKAIEVVEIPENAVIGQCFQILSDHTISNNLHEAATDCLCTLLQCMEENNNNESVERLIFNSVVALEQSYHMAVAHEEQEKALNYSRIFTELAETFLEKVMNGCYGKNSNHFALKSLDLVLVCVGHHDYEVAEVSFNLWYRLSEILYHKDNEELTIVFKPHIERLIAGLCRHCQMEPDHQGLLEKGDDFYDFRMKVLELIRDVVFITGSNNCFRQMFLSLQGTDVSWEQTEAALYIMQAVAKNILPEEYEIVPKVVEAILAMPDTAHTAVRKTCVLLLGELCEWIDRHPECLQSTLECLLRALQDDLLAVASAQSLHSVSKACKRHMAVHLNGLLQIVRTLDTFKLTPEAAIGLIRGVAAIIGHLPQEQVTVAMREATGIQLTALASLTSSEVLPSSKSSPTDLILWLDRLAALFRDVGTQPPENGHQHPCLQALIDAWPVISSAMDKYSRDSRAMERLCRTLKFSLRCVGKQAAPLLEPLVLKMISVYTSHGHSCFLYLSSILVDEFASEPGCVQGLMNMLQALIPKAFEILQQNNGLQENPDTVDDLFRLCMRFLQRAPIPFLQSPVMPAIMQCGILACTLDHRDANSSVMKFFYDLAVAGHSKRSDDTIKGLIETIINQYGQLLINSIIQATVFSLSDYLLADVADVILELMFWNKSALNQWLEVAIKQLPQNTTTASATTVQMAQFHQTVMQCEKAKEMTRALRDFARLYR